MFAKKSKEQSTNKNKRGSESTPTNKKVKVEGGSPPFICDTKYCVNGKLNNYKVGDKKT